MAGSVVTRRRSTPPRRTRGPATARVPRRRLARHRTSSTPARPEARSAAWHRRRRPGSRSAQGTRDREISELNRASSHARNDEPQSDTDEPVSGLQIFSAPAPIGGRLIARRSTDGNSTGPGKVHLRARCIGSGKSGSLWGTDSPANSIGPARTTAAWHQSGRRIGTRDGGSSLRVETAMLEPLAEAGAVGRPDWLRPRRRGQNG